MVLTVIALAVGAFLLLLLCTMPDDGQHTRPPSAWRRRRQVRKWRWQIQDLHSGHIDAWHPGRGTGENQPPDPDGAPQ